MIKRLAKWILSSEIAAYKSEVKSLREDNCAYRKESEGMADIKLRLKVAEMYIDDDEAIDQLLAAKKEQENTRVNPLGERAGTLEMLLGYGPAASRARQHNAAQGMQGVSILAGLGQQNAGMYSRGPFA